MERQPGTRDYIDTLLVRLHELRAQGELHVALSVCKEVQCALAELKARNDAAWESMSPASIFRNVRSKAEAGDPRNQYSLGRLCCTGEMGQAVDHEEMVKWWAKAADQGFVCTDKDAIGDLSRSGKFDPSYYLRGAMAERWLRSRSGVDIFRVVVLILLLIFFCKGADAFNGTLIPKGFFILLRWIVCSLLAVTAYRAYKSSRFAWAWIFGVDAAIFNPAILTRLGDVWILVDIITAALIATSFFLAFGSAPKSE